MAQKVDVTGWSTADYLRALQRGTSCVWPLEAAVWLLDRHGVWLDDPRFRAYVEVTLDHEDEPWAGIDVEGVNAAVDAGEFGEWREEIAVLCIVLSLYGNYPIPLRYTCENLSKEAVALIGKALYLASGYDEPK